MLRRLLLSAVLALLALAPAVAGAQFTTFISPRSRVTDSVKAVVAAAQKAQADSMAAARVTNMKTWVDSAAGLAPSPTAAVDSVAAGTSAGDSLTAGTSAGDSLTAGTSAADTALPRAGIPAPATASNLPLYVVVGAVSLMLGGALVAGGAGERGRRA